MSSPDDAEKPRAIVHSEPGLDDRLADAARRNEEWMTAHQMRRAVLLFVLLWVASFVLDFVAAYGSSGVPLQSLLLARLVPLPVLALVGLRVGLRGGRVPIRSAQRMLLVSDLAAAVWLSLLALVVGGLDSPYQVTLMFVPLSLAVVPFPWKLGLVRHFAINVAYVATMLVGYYGVGLGRRAGEPDGVELFLVHVMLMHAMSASLVLVSHTLWALRREVFTTKHVGRYELRRLIGKGGMGEVWAAWHTTLRREVALKLVRVDDASAVDTSARFEREITAMTKLSHPNTVRIYDFGAEEGGLLYCAMELLEGEDLGAIVKREGPMAFARAERLMFQASSAIAEAHSIGIVHRDIKPENLFVVRIAGGREVLKVLDFGIASIVGLGEERLTHRDAIAGTPATMSPEIIRGEAVTPASDVYALGCVGYYLLTGAMPFGATRTMAVLNAHLHDPPVPPSVRTAEPIPPTFEAIVMRCLAKDPVDRYASGNELAAALVALDRRGVAEAPRLSAAGPRERESVAPTAMHVRPARPEPTLGPELPPDRPRET